MLLVAINNLACSGKYYSLGDLLAYENNLLCNYGMADVGFLSFGILFLAFLIFETYIFVLLDSQQKMDDKLYISLDS